MDLAVVDTDQPLAEQAATMATACESLGFFRIPLSAVDRSMADAAWATAGDFFALPEVEKRLVEFPHAGYPYGYSPFGFESLARSTGDEASAGPDLKESFSVGPDCGPTVDAGPAEEWIRSPSIWPDRPADLRESWRAYFRELAGVSEHLMSVMAIALDLSPNYFASLIDRPMSSMRALRYPEIGGDPGTSIRAGAHTDYGTLTILRTDNVSGLEIQQPDGAWAAVESQPDTFIVNLGDSIAQWTNDRWRSTMHRVALTSSQPRQSFAFFHMANWDATIECLPTCQDPGEPPKYEPIQAGPWLMRKFQSTVT